MISDAMNEMIWFIPLLVWLVILLLPWQPWRNRETLEVACAGSDTDLSDITVIIPARNEANQISQTLGALSLQGENLHVIVVDDQSQDGTAGMVRRFQDLDITVIDGLALPDGWTGKLWPLQQGYAKVDRPITVLLDADITLAQGTLASLREKMRRESISFISVMANLSMRTFWQKLLLPAFVYYFKQLYPFALANNRRIKYVAAAAGGCIMLESDALKKIGGFKAIRETLIDDCALAKLMKRNGYSTWVGLTRNVQSHRPYSGLRPIWDMVSRTAFHQLKYSLSLLLGLSLIFITLYGLPWMGLLNTSLIAQSASVLSLTIMAGIYIPILRYYQLSPLWSLAMPLIAALYLAMTWYSAIEHWLGSGNNWRGRRYYKHSKVEEIIG